MFDLRPARLTTARLYDRLDHTSYRTYDNFCLIYTYMYTMRFDLRPLQLTTGWSEPNAVVSRTLSVIVSTHSGWCPFGMVSIRDCVHSGWCPFGIVSIRDCVHLGLCPFGMMSIRDFAHSGLCPFGNVFFGIVYRIRFN